jgi:hypothetical protein
MAASEGTAPPVEVELQIFSGRPNPGWTLEGAAAGEAVARARAALDGQSVPAAAEAGLGYAGFRLTIPEGRSRRTFEVFRGVISSATADNKQHWLDARDLEGFLLDQASERGFARLLADGGAPPSRGR